MGRPRKNNVKKTVSRRDIAREVADTFDMSVSEAELLEEFIFSRIADHVLADEEVWILHFGQFSLQEYKGRRIRHPRTGEEMQTSATKAMKFRPATTLRQFKQDEPEQDVVPKKTSRRTSKKQ